MVGSEVNTGYGVILNNSEMNIKDCWISMVTIKVFKLMDQK
jgi:hypothetical protein